MRQYTPYQFIPDDPLARREAPAEGRRPEGEGANIDRRLVPYHAKCIRIQSRIEFIYIYIFICINGLFATACEGWVLGKRLRKAITKVQKAESKPKRQRLRR